VVITGTLTNLCCSTTARRAYERGYAVIFGSDVTATHTEELQQAELQTMRYGFARVLNAQEICDFFSQRF
jgi:nicotinamidase-related amidase